MADFTFIDKPMLEVSDSQKEVIADEAIEALAKGRGVLSKSVTAAGTITLTADESRYGVILLTGTPAGTTTVVQDAGVTTAIWFRNDTTSGQTINVKADSGTSFPVPAGDYVLLLNTTNATRFGRDIAQLIFNAATVTWTNQPAGNTEFLGLTDRRTKYDLTYFTQVRLIANVEVVGVAGALLRGEYSPDESVWNDLENGGGSGPQVVLDAAGTQVSSWVLIPSGAKADSWLRIVGINGDGAADPQIGLVALQFK